MMGFISSRFWFMLLLSFVADYSDDIAIISNEYNTSTMASADSKQIILGHNVSERKAACGKLRSI